MTTGLGGHSELLALSVTVAGAGPVGGVEEGVVAVTQQVTTGLGLPLSGQHALLVAHHATHGCGHKAQGSHNVTVLTTGVT